MRAPVFRGNLIVSNLPNEFTATDLAALFDSYGLVLGAKIEERWHDRPGGTQGMVDLAPATSVDKAIAELSGQTIQGNKIVIRRVPPRVKAPKRPAPPRPGPAAASAPRRIGAQEGNPVGDYAAGRDYQPNTAISRPVTTRKVVVEYRAPSRRVVIPPRARSADAGNG